MAAVLKKMVLTEMGWQANSLSSLHEAVPASFPLERPRKLKNEAKL